ncbi:DUF4870 domain-containing protein [Brevibacterium sp. GP-SGM9]|uniref:DUF4870 domain-containing protein n=1 Tax=unclassified Brevibacterium TaxID=2614124 RepID=UPI001E2EAC9D|nr:MULTISPECIES: DUF4870 domain-containing protein [unclassified Brevibacterium]MCD1285044.1 DUF4870 domain-containing protein [Brevibacterium sp. CCUG 69071]MDK8435333.1 DUF4870 domain-containing protein [Brevibacterium sp. H-BE7]
MSNNPEQPNNGRPMPPNYSQASGPQQPYTQQNQSVWSQQQYGSQQSQPQYGSQQQSYGSQQQNPQSYGAQHSGYGSQQQYSQQQYAQQPYGAGAQSYGYGAPQAVNPALFNSQALPENAYGPGSEQFWQPSESERTTVMWTHIGALFIGFLPLIMFLVKKDESPFVREHTRQGLNAWITNVIATFAATFVLGIVGFILALVTFGIGIIVMYLACLIPLVYVVLYIIAAIAGSKGEGYKFPLTFNFVK